MITNENSGVLSADRIGELFEMMETSRREDPEYLFVSPEMARRIRLAYFSRAHGLHTKRLLRKSVRRKIYARIKQARSRFLHRELCREQREAERQAEGWLKVLTMIPRSELVDAERGIWKHTFDFG